MVAGRIFLLIACLLFSDVLAAATLTATVDKKEILANEYVILTLSLINSDTRLRAQGISPNVDLTLLTKDFELGVPRETHRFNISRDRGRSTSELTVELFPRRPGKFVIPSFTVDNVSSRPVQVQVHKGAADATPEVFTRSGVSKEDVWQREQVIVYLDLYHRVELKSAKLGGDIDIEPLQLELHKLKESQRQETVRGLSYNVERTEWAITPFLSEDYKIYLPDIWIVTSDERKIRLPFEEQHIGVKALPDNVPPLAMIGKPEISQHGFKDAAHVDQVSPWTITIRTPASPTTLPDELPGLNTPGNLKIYHDAAERNFDQESTPVMSVASYRFYLIPLAAGQFTLPEIRIPYFDPQRGVMDVATLAGQTLVVEAAVQSATPSATASLPPISAREIITTTGSRETSLVWKSLSIAALILWLLTLALWWATRRQAKDSISQPQQKTARTGRHPLQTALLKAFDSRTLEEGLHSWELAHGKDPEIRKTVRAVQNHIYGKDKATRENTLHTEVKKALDKITHAKSQNGRLDPWSPRSFTPRLIFIEDKR
jgi:BatD DUF11 like domain